jgi:hypothetical protein
MKERRQNVRVRPAADYDIQVEYVDGLVSVRLAVMDVAIGGMGLVVDELFLGSKPGTLLPLKITFPGFPQFETKGEIRHCSAEPGGKCGIRLGALTAEQTTVLRAAVAELQERGHSA